LNRGTPKTKPCAQKEKKQKSSSSLTERERKCHCQEALLCVALREEEVVVVVVVRRNQSWTRIDSLAVNGDARCVEGWWALRADV
jgi:hypothetical protein